jgi:3',5'-cyclic AMP phosphodiesterase CpdA
MNVPIFLHITDAHVTGQGVELARDDYKTKFPGIGHSTREEVLQRLLARIAERLSQEQREIDAVIFSGDAAERGDLGGHQALLDTILKELDPVGINASRIVATPGNHDVPRETAPGSPERYQAFIDAWRKAGCITPWLDGVDDKNTFDPNSHRLVAADGAWAIYPLNSANWSHTTSELEEPLATIWGGIEGLMTSADPKEVQKLKRQLAGLIRFDMARVSEEQLEVFRRIVADTDKAHPGSQIRIAAIHHHLRTPSLREEVKAFADFTNLELLRSSLRERRIDVLIHGHKHQHAARRELLDDHNGGSARPLLVVSGATFDSQHEDDAVRTLELAGLPFIPSVQMERFAIGRGGNNLKSAKDESISLWRPIGEAGGSTVIHGANIDEVYHRACEAAETEANGSTLIVDLDLPLKVSANIPTGYPSPSSMEGEGRERWFNELAAWWQLEHSRLEKRVPYHHGTRLYRYAGTFDQMKRVKAILSDKASSRAVAILIDPIRDFTADGKGENFASFCSVQFRKREVGERKWQVDVVAYYRAQEFRRWWPINIAELRALQLSVCVGGRTSPGRITTITAEARAIGRSPTEVSVPVIDRWLDQHPGRLFLLATYLASEPATGRDQTRDEVVEGWMQSLADFEQATREFNPDGVPLAIEGLQALCLYLGALKPTGDLATFLEALEGLANANIAYDRTKKGEDDFTKWGAKSFLGRLRTLSSKLLDINPD